MKTILKSFNRFIPWRLGVLAVLFLGGCAGLDNYDRSYSLNVSDGKQSVGVGVTFHPRSTPLPAPRGFAK